VQWLREVEADEAGLRVTDLMEVVEVEGKIQGMKGEEAGHIEDAAETEFVDSSWKQDSAALARNASFPTI